MQNSCSPYVNVKHGFFFFNEPSSVSMKLPNSALMQRAGTDNKQNHSKTA